MSTIGICWGRGWLDLDRHTLSGLWLHCRPTGRVDRRGLPVYRVQAGRVA